MECSFIKGLIPVLVIYVVSLDRVNGMCFQTDLRDCFVTLSTFGKGYGRIFYNKDQVKEKCRLYDKSRACLDKTFKECDSTLTKSDKDSASSYRAMMGFIRPLCEYPDMLKEYNKHITCIQKYQREFRACHSKKINVNSSMPQHEIERSLCCAYHQQSDCVTTLYYNNCSSETAEFIDYYLKILAGSHTVETCHPYEFDCLNQKPEQAARNKTILPTEIISTMETCHEDHCVHAVTVPSYDSTTILSMIFSNFITNTFIFLL